MSYIDPFFIEVPINQVLCQVRVKFGCASEHEYLAVFDTTIDALLDAQEKYSDMACKISVRAI